jgi:hypothetical protein
VQLHSPSVSYGVNSLELSTGRTNSDGHNKGCQEQASGVAINCYFQQLLKDRLKASGKVRFFQTIALTCSGYAMR